MDLKRLQQYQNELKDLSDSIEFGAYWDIIEAKLVKFLALNPGLDLDDLELKREIEKAFAPDYNKWSKELLLKSNDIITVVNDLYQDLGFDIDRDFAKIKALETINRMNLGEYGDRTTKRIKKAVREGLAEKLNQDELRGKIGKVGGRVKTYADVIAHTQIKSYGRACKYEKSLLAEVTWFEYVGRLRKTTRPFCENALKQKMYRLEDIKNMDNGKGQPKPVIVYCGGWRCFHDWEPDPFFKE